MKAFISRRHIGHDRREVAHEEQTAKWPHGRHAKRLSSAAHKAQGFEIDEVFCWCCRSSTVLLCTIGVAITVSTGLGFCSATMAWLGIRILSLLPLMHVICLSRMLTAIRRSQSLMKSSPSI